MTARSLSGPSGQKSPFIVHLTYAAGTKAANGTQVARARFDGSMLQDLQVIFKAMRLKDTDNHYGGRMVL